jgi:uncharacterized protein
MPPPPTDTPPAILSDADVAELDRHLQALPDEHDALDVEMLDGFLAAILLEPQPVPPADWLPFVFDAQGRGDVMTREKAAVERALPLIMRRHNELAAYLAAREPFEPIIFELERDDGQPLAGKAAIEALEPWAGGFAYALAAFPSLREALAADETGSEALAGILQFLSDDDAAAYGEDARGELGPAPADLDEAIDVLVASVLDAADVTRPRRPIARETPKVGRNDPCPCGSGRKFKHCHGASAH